MHTGNVQSTESILEPATYLLTRQFNSDVLIIILTTNGRRNQIDSDLIRAEMLGQFVQGREYFFASTYFVVTLVGAGLAFMLGLLISNLVMR